MQRFVCLLLLAGWAGVAGAENLLFNGGFEETASHELTAAHWKMNEPDDHGDMWGNAIRANWRAHEGRHIAAVRGAWAEMGDYGGVWQEARITGGSVVKATAWFWADNNWLAELQEFKIEFWNEDRTEQVGEERVSLMDVGEIWVQKEVAGKAPDAAAWARVVINIAGVGQNGSLQIDEVSLEATAP